MSKIEYIRITLKPANDYMNIGKKIYIEILTDKERYGTVEIIHNDDIQSYFDRCMELSIKKLKDMILKAESENE